jgi:thiol-disulfide isomerase/thioredoxin
MRGMAMNVGGRPWRGVVAVIVVIGVLLGLWQLTQQRSRPSDDVSGDPGSGLTLYPDDRGIPLPDITGRTIAGKMLSLREMRGNVLVLNVWGSWCAPCRAEAPDLATISAETRARGVRFVGIDVRDNPAAALAFERRYGITYPSFDDQDGLVLAQFTGIIPVSAVPSTLVADRNGVIRSRVIGRIEPSMLRGLIEDAEEIR